MSSYITIFVIPMMQYKDGGSKEYWGLGYKVIKCNTLAGDKSAHFGFYNLDIGKVCNHDVDVSQFIGEIVEINQNGSFIVEPNENEDVRKSADKISVSGSSDINWEIGMKVIVKYIGGVMESYPAQINVIDVQLYNSDDFTIFDETKYLAKPCDTALELIYEDDSFKYYFGCIKSHMVFIAFEDGTRISIKEAQLISSRNWIKLVIEKYPDIFIKEAK